MNNNKSDALTQDQMFSGEESESFIEEEIQTDPDEAEHHPIVDED